MNEMVYGALMDRKER